MRLSIKYCEEFLFVHPLVVLLYYWLAEKLPLFCWPRMCKIKVKKNFKYNFEKKWNYKITTRKNYSREGDSFESNVYNIACSSIPLPFELCSVHWRNKPRPSVSMSFFWFPFYNAKITSALKDDIKNGNVFSIHSSCQSRVPHLFFVNTQIYNLFWTEHYEARHKSVS